MIRLSIIIPFYNVEKYISRCLDSVFHQDISEMEYEVICVNDASPDKSRDIVIEYQKVHKNLILVEHEHNKKLGSARNTGRSIARGKYIWNVDSDDYIADNCLCSVLKKCEQNNLDILQFNTLSFTDFEMKDMNVQRSDTNVVESGLQCLHQNLGNIGQFCPVWRSIYSKEFLDNNLIYSPEINMGEDLPYAFKSLILSKRLMAINDIYYFYRINPSSLTGVKILSPQVLYEKCFLAARLLLDVLSFIPTSYSEVSQAMKDVIRYIVYMFFDLSIRMSQKDKKMFASICRKNILRDVCLFRLMNNKNKILYIKILLTT